MSMILLKLILNIKYIKTVVQNLLMKKLKVKLAIVER